MSEQGAKVLEFSQNNELEIKRSERKQVKMLKQ